MARPTVLVTAAASGLARGVAIDLARAGYGIAFTHRPGGTSPGETLAAVRDAGDADVVAIAADHGVAGESARAVREAERHVGPLEAYVHSVGPIVVKRFERTTFEETRAMLAGNLESAIEAADAILPGMRARGFGRLVFFGMNGSHETRPACGMSVYGAAKAAVVAFARTLALEEAAKGITINIIEPGDIRDKRVDRAGARDIPANNPTGHAGSWEDVAYAVRFLIARDAGFINGMTIGVNGGLVEPHE